MGNSNQSSDAGGDSVQSTATANSTDSVTGTETGITRRSALQVGAGSAAAGLLSISTIGSAAAAPPETLTWLTDDVADQPLYTISLPGTHHSAMYNGGPDWWHCQSQDVYTQLRDGIRYLDFRIGAWDDGGTVKFDHHHGGARSPQPHKWGVSLDDEAFPDVRQFLEEAEAQGASEFIIAKVGFFWDSRLLDDDEFEDWQYEAFQKRLEDAFGEYLLDLSNYTSSELLNTAPSEFDGPKLAICYRSDAAQKPPWAGWTNEYIRGTGGQGVPGEEPGGELVSAITGSHTDTSTFGQTSMMVNAGDIENIFEGWFDIESNFSDLYQGAERTNALLPGFVNAAKRDPELNPNIVMLDYYELSNVVQYCRELSQQGLHGDTVEEAPDFAEGTKRLESVDTGMVADVDHAGVDDGTNIHVWNWNDSGAQHFDLAPNDDHTYRIRNTNSGKVADVSGSGTDNGANIHQWAWHGGDNQRWYVVDVDTHPGEYVLVNKHSGLVFDASDSSEGSTIHQWTMHNRDNQRWRINDASTEYSSEGAGTNRDPTGGGGPGFTLPIVGTALGGAAVLSRIFGDDGESS